MQPSSRHACDRSVNEKRSCFFAADTVVESRRSSASKVMVDDDRISSVTGTRIGSALAKCPTVRSRPLGRPPNATVSVWSRDDPGIECAWVRSATTASATLNHDVRCRALHCASSCVYDAVSKQSWTQWKKHPYVFTELGPSRNLTVVLRSG
ncbi:unnamed protein product [Mycena citricolor]|uniref:Uncharacterized protein n=1 Tax=Mycena citricolor TaxID=2018698 RepID=A0AAD2K4W0_9AGAR|nr:unnamed protein product [Mycena citricolor]CAK5278860.1 unnamed protein product [Mycena citricolor]CAK5278879.1 unnamed protein product [Mycena citricolor]